MHSLSTINTRKFVGPLKIFCTSNFFDINISFGIILLIFGIMMSRTISANHLLIKSLIIGALHWFVVNWLKIHEPFIFRLKLVYLETVKMKDWFLWREKQILYSRHFIYFSNRHLKRKINSHFNIHPLLLNGNVIYYLRIN